MLGIAARGSKGVTQGELIGFRGTTFNTTHNTDAPHVHWTFKGSWEGSSALVDLTDDQIIKAFSVLNDSMGSSINAGTCF